MDSAELGKKMGEEEGSTRRTDEAEGGTKRKGDGGEEETRKVKK